MAWLTLYARPVRSAPTYYKRGWMRVIFHCGDQLYVAYDSAELKRLVRHHLDVEEGKWYEANIIDIEHSLGYELEPE
jgi:hypothetical protein